MFAPKNLLGYQKYVGQEGTTTKSGCGFYISDSITFIPRNDLDKHFYNQINEFSCKWIEVINKNKTNIIIASIYRHPSKNDTDFLEYLNKTLLNIKKENLYIMLTGDFNYNLLNYDKSKEINEFLDIMLSNCCQPYIIFPTRIVSNAIPSLVDTIFFNNIENNPISGNLTCKITDHMPNFLICQKFNKDVKNIKRKKRDFSKFNKEAFLQDLNTINLDHYDKNINDTNEQFNMLNNKIIDIFNKHAPIRILSNRETKNLLKPWLSSGILKSIKIKNNLYSKFMKCLNPIWYNKYKLYRDKINHLIRTSKDSYYKRYFTCFNRNSKKIGIFCQIKDYFILQLIYK